MKLSDSNYQIRVATGVQKFHDAGYFGERVIAASGETWHLDEFNPDGLCLNPCNYDSQTDHAKITAKTFFEVAPKARLAMFSSSGSFKSGDKPYKSKLMEEGFPKIAELGITAMFTSLSSKASNTRYFKDYEQKMKELPYFCSCFSAGNEGLNQTNKMNVVDGVYIIGGASYRGGKWQMEGRSSSDEEEYLVDFVTTWNSNGNSGTSIAAPWFCGMICLVNDFFIDKTGKPLTREKMTQFLIDCCQDIDEKGFDKCSGHGLPVLPDPKDIDIWKYAEKDEGKTNDPDEGNTGEESKPIDPPIDNPDSPPESADSWAQEWWIKGYNKTGEDNKRICDGTKPQNNLSRQELIVMLGRLGLLD